MTAKRRQTRQGRAVLEAIQLAGRPLGPGEILTAAAESVDSLSQATVYRQIRRLREDGLIREVVLPGTPDRYEAVEESAFPAPAGTPDDRLEAAEGVASGAVATGSAGPTPSGSDRRGSGPRRGADAASGHHHFFHCEDCDAVYPVPGCSGDVERPAPPEFEVRRHEVVLYGRCRRCATGEGGTPVD